MIRDMETFNPEVCPLLTEAGAPQALQVRLGLSLGVGNGLLQRFFSFSSLVEGERPMGLVLYG